MSFTFPSSDSLHRGHTVEVQSQNKELIEDMSVYEDASLQHRLKTFPRQYYSIAFAVEDSETDLTAEVDEHVEATVERAVNDGVSHEFFNEELMDDMCIYEDASLQQRLTTFPRQYYTLAFAVEDSESDLTAEVVEDEEVTVEKAVDGGVSHVFTNLHMEEEAACMRFVDDFVTSVIHNAVSFVEAEEEDAILDRAARNIITDVIEKVSCDILIDDLISITINRALSDVDAISCRHVKDSDPKTSQTESSSGKGQDSDCIQQPMTNPLSLATTPAASEPVLVGHHESVDKLTTSTTHLADFEIPHSATSEESTRHKPRTVLSPKDPGDADRTTPTNPTKGLGLGSTQINYMQRADPSSKDPGGTNMQAPPKVKEGPDQEFTNKTHHMELRSGQSHIDPREITQSKSMEGLGSGEVSQREVDPPHRPRNRSMIQTLLRRIGRSLTLLGRPFVPCFGGG